MPSVEKFYIRHMAFVRGCTKKDAIRLLGRQRLFSSILALEIEVREGLYYWR